MIAHDAYPVEPWAVRETDLDLDMLAQSESIFALSNGHLGIRGNLDEGEPRALSGTYLNGFYASRPLAYGEHGYGFAEVGQTIVNVTDGKLIRLLVDDEPLDVRLGRLDSHQRVLDLRAGTVERTLRWMSPSERSVQVSSRRLVSFAQPSVAAISYEVQALDAPVQVAVQSELLANQRDRSHRTDPRGSSSLGRVLRGRLDAHSGRRVVLAHTARSSALTVAAGMDHVVVAPGAVQTKTESEPDLGRVTISVELLPGETLQVVKLLAYHWSGEESVEWLRDQVDASLQIALAQGFNGLLAAQRTYLDAHWAVADIELEGDPEIQQALRFALFEVLQASARAERRAIAAKGLSGTGYDGHAFWDTESFVLPTLTYTRPDLARDALLWRHSTLDLARDRARQLGLRGAALPWRTINGEESSGYWPAGMAAFHINADVADAVRRYVKATGDEVFEREAGVELLTETARLWTSLGHYGKRGRFCIDGVTGPDEYSALSDNNVYTNLLAQTNLRCAADAAERHLEKAKSLDVDADEIASWRHAAKTMRLPYDTRLGIHPQNDQFTTHEQWDFAATSSDEYPLLLGHTYFDLYRKQVVKQADLVLALFRRGDAFTAEQKRRDFDYYEPLTVRDSSLSACVQAVIAAEVGHLALAYDYLGEAALMDLHDLEHNVGDGLHVASLSGAVTAVVAGLGGMRDYGSDLSFAPRLPPGIDRLAFQILWRQSRLRVEVGLREASYTIRPGEPPVSLVHWGERLKVTDAAPVIRPVPAAPELTSPSQPPGRAPARRGR